MGQLRRKVFNYTIVALAKEGAAPNFHLRSFAALRIRDGKETAFHYCRQFPKDDRKAAACAITHLRRFIGDDLVLIGVVSDMIPTMEKLYQDYCHAFFTNVSVDLFPVVEEVDELVQDPTAFSQKVLSARQETDTLKKARSMYDIYEEASSLLYGYQEGYPYWVCSLPYEEERYLAKHLPARKKYFKKALLSWFFACHYFYFGRKWTNLLYLLAAGGCFVWTLIDLYRLPVMVDNANEQIALETYKNAPKITRPDSMKWNVPDVAIEKEP